MNIQDSAGFDTDASFLTGANAAYIEDLYARFEADPGAVDAEWAAYFTSLKDGREAIEASARGASWKHPNWPIAASGEMVSALDGHWPSAEPPIDAAQLKEKVKTKAKEKALEMTAAEVERATRDSVRSIMMIRAYRMRGHLLANLDPLGLEQRGDDEGLHPQNYGFTEADYGRKIFIDNVLGLESATIPEMLAVLRRTYCGTIGFEFMHMSDPAEKAWMQMRIEGDRKSVV